MAKYVSPTYPLTDRQETAWVEVYQSVIDTAPVELRHLFEHYENILMNRIVENIRVPRLRDTHIETARKYAKGWMATLLEQGHLNKLLARAASTSESLADTRTASR